MIRPLTIVTFLMACGSGLYLYEAKHDAQVLDRTIEKTVRDTSSYRDQSRLLATEWTMLNDPESLRHYADLYLTLKTISPSQFTSPADLDSRLPAVMVLPPVRNPNEATPEPVAEVPDPATPPQPVAIASRAGTGSDAAGGVERAGVPSSAVSSPVPVSPVATSMAAAVPGRPVERKSAVSRAATAEATPGTSASDPAGPLRVVTTPESRPATQHAADPRAADRRVAQSTDNRLTEAHAAEARGADTHPAGTLPPPRPLLVAAEARPVATPAVGGMPPNRLAAPMPVQTPVRPASGGGSLLGMARNSIAPPRPTQVNATQWNNPN